MLASPTLTSEQFKQAHNALCELSGIVGRLEGVINADLHGRLAKVEDTIREAFSGAYAQDDALYEARRTHYDEQAALNGINHSSWSMYEVADLLQPHNYGPVDRVVYKDHWGEVAVSASVQGNTWAALWRAADECIRLSEDSHHIFIEDFRVSSDDPRTLVLHTGS